MLVVLAATVAGLSQSPARDGRLIAQEPCKPKQLAYADWLDLQQSEYAQEAKFAEAHGVTLEPFATLRPKLQTADEFRRRRAYEGFVCQRLTYESEGLKVAAYLWRPKDVEGKRLPLIIFNRGGGQDLGKLLPWEHDGFFDYVDAGFAVLGSQYRGNDGGEGHDEEGGREVRDVLNLIPLAKSLGYLDTDNVFMMGDSRGAMMTFLAMRAGATMRAAAVVGAETDLAANLQRRPELREGYAKDTPGFTSDPEQAMRTRSAIYWADAISAPVLLMHGGKDWRVPPDQDRAFATKLRSLHKRYRLMVFEGDTHLLPFHWRERDRATIEWFEAHMDGSPTPGPPPGR